MVGTEIKRTLWYQRNDERVTLNQLDLLQLTVPAVVLGEAGMGKTHLLEWLGAQPDHAYCTARQLINRHDPASLLRGAAVLVIDAIDEVGAQKEGDAVDSVLRRLGEIGCPRFVLSCRVADWRAATGAEAIEEQYPSAPIQLYLEPFSDVDVSAFLGAVVGTQRAADVGRHFSLRGLAGLLGNPQTLEMISKVVIQGDLPETRAELFERATDLLAVEHRGSKVERRPSRISGLDAAGAAFAALIVTSSAAVDRVGALADDELKVADIARLPDAQAVVEMLDSRLFKAVGCDRFSYWHRRIGEFLGARWLSKQANTKRKQRRLLALFHSHGLVPASLRGIHAWLARDPALSQAVIAGDPMGVIEYGDADRLTAQQGRWLLGSLERLAAENPRFRDWGRYSVRGIVQPALMDDVRRLITAPETPYGLRLLVLESIKGAQIAGGLASELRAIILDKAAIFASRKAAAEALAELSLGDDWRVFAHRLLECGDELSVRLAIELIDLVGYDCVDDDLLVELVVAHLTSDDRTVGILYRLERRLPISRIAGVLDQLASAAAKLGSPHERPGGRGFSDFAYHLINRRVEAGNLSGDVLWSWLEPFDASVGHHGQDREQLAAMLRSDDVLRRTVQRLVLLEMPGDMNVWQRALRLERRSSGLAVTPGDVLSLLRALDPSREDDERWRDAVQLVRHDGDIGAEVREAAKSFAHDRDGLVQWLDGLAVQTKPLWMLAQEEEDRERKAKREAKNAETRRDYVANIESIRGGDCGAIVELAKVYLRMFIDIDGDLPPHERVKDWLGDEVRDAAHIGFDEFLRKQLKPCANDIAESIAQGKHWEAGYIIVAALAERCRKGLGFGDLADERLMAGFFELCHRRIGEHAGIEPLEGALREELKARGVWASAMRALIEPQLAAGREYVDGLYDLMRNEENASIAAMLAAEWLERFPQLPLQVEEELVDRLLRSNRNDELRQLCGGRAPKSEEGRRLWSAVGLIVDFPGASVQLDQTPIEPELLWAIRGRTAGRFDDGARTELSSAQAEWIFSRFRHLWPRTGYPRGGFMGDENPWDASEYLISMVRRLGNDSSLEAATFLQRLRNDVDDEYTELVQVISAEQARLRVERSYVAPTLGALEAIVTDSVPSDAADLQAFMLEELTVTQAKILSDDAESWRGFFDDDGVPYPEERCRDHLLGLLRQSVAAVALEPESHVAGDKEVDITCAVGNLRMPIEIKGQWHAELWSGADRQLDALYARDWRAEGRGIYLVLWFGSQQAKNKALTSRGRGKPAPRTASELREMLVASSRSAREGRIAVFVLEVYGK